MCRLHLGLDADAHATLAGSQRAECRGKVVAHLVRVRAGVGVGVRGRVGGLGVGYQAEPSGEVGARLKQRKPSC